MRRVRIALRTAEALRRAACGGAQSGKTPLHDAAICGYLDIVQLLLERGADKEAKDNVRALLPPAKRETVGCSTHVATGRTW